MTNQEVPKGGFLYIKHGAVGSRSEGPIYYLQTLTIDYILHFKERLPQEKDYYLESFNNKMVNVDGVLENDNFITLNRLWESNAGLLSDFLLNF